MTAPRLSIPALTFRVDGRVDAATTTAYAQRAGRTWLDAFILSGTTTEGSSFTVPERARVLDLWLAVVARDRLLACCWHSQDVEQAVARGVRPLVVMRGLTSRAEALDFLGRIPPDAYVYSHPLHTPTVLDASLLAAANEKGVLPAGAKITKIPAGALPELREAVGPEFDLWDGSSRRIAASLAEGASGVISTPLAAIPEPFPAPDERLQTTVDLWQSRLDEVPGEAERADWLRSAAAPALSGN